MIYAELGIMAEVATPCEACEGKRFQPEVLEYEFGGRNIHEVLTMPVAEALDSFGAGEAGSRPPNESSNDSATWARKASLRGAP